VQDLICNAAKDQNTAHDISDGADEVVLISEKHIQRTLKSCIGKAGMRRLVLCILALTALSGYVLAHTPAGVVVTYDETTGDLGVAITHQVDNSATHYVKRVTVHQGNTVLIDQSYTSQPGTSAFNYRYNLPQLKGSSGEIRVDTECNIGGSRSGTLTLGATPVAGTPGGAPPSPTRAPMSVFVVLLAAGLAASRILV
jgi:hypothetical protein